MASSMQFPIEVTSNEVDLPVLDISQFPADLDEQGMNNLQYHPGVATIREACKEWGFFLLVNHGIPDDLLQNVKSISSELFSLPTEAKERAATCNQHEGYFRFRSVEPTFETFNTMDLPNGDTLFEMSQKIWPQQGKDFCETIRTYSLCLSDLAQKITKIILASLRLDSQTFYASDFHNCKTFLRINHFTSDGKINGVVALPAHADAGCLTILSAEDVGGLQIRSKEGKWLNIKPLALPHSFVVNLGDSLKVWSNGIYRSAEHRVICTGWTDRMSFAYPLHFPDDKQIWAPAELVDHDNPRRYKAFTPSQLKQLHLQAKTRTENLVTLVETFEAI